MQLCKILDGKVTMKLLKSSCWLKLITFYIYRNLQVIYFLVAPFIYLCIFEMSYLVMLCSLWFELLTLMSVTLSLSNFPKAAELEIEAYPLLDELTSKISTLNLERVRRLKSRLVALTRRVQKVSLNAF